jgi:hypothetical protein
VVATSPAQRDESEISNGPAGDLGLPASFELYWLLLQAVEVVLDLAKAGHGSTFYLIYTKAPQALETVCLQRFNVEKLYLYDLKIHLSFAINSQQTEVPQEFPAVSCTIVRATAPLLISAAGQPDKRLSYFFCFFYIKYQKAYLEIRELKLNDTRSVNHGERKNEKL